MKPRLQAKKILRTNKERSSINRMMKLPPTTLAHRSHHTKPTLELWPDIAIAFSRVHEACGANRRSLALLIAQKIQGPIFWVSPTWNKDTLHAEGIMQFINPGRLTFLAPKRAEDILWTVEEVLRSGAVGLVVADLPGIPSLTPIRRLQLAAETGATKGDIRSLGLLLTPGSGGAPGIESRWHIAAKHKDYKDLWHLSRIRARTDPPCSWQVSHTDGMYSISKLGIEGQNCEMEFD